MYAAVKKSAYSWECYGFFPRFIQRVAASKLAAIYSYAPRLCRRFLHHNQFPFRVTPKYTHFLLWLTAFDALMPSPPQSPESLCVKSINKNVDCCAVFIDACCQPHSIKHIFRAMLINANFPVFWHCSTTFSFPLYKLVRSL